MTHLIYGVSAGGVVASELQGCRFKSGADCVSVDAQFSSHSQDELLTLTVCACVGLCGESPAILFTMLPALMCPMFLPDKC